MCYVFKGQTTGIVTKIMVDCTFSMNDFSDTGTLQKH